MKRDCIVVLIVLNSVVFNYLTAKAESGIDSVKYHTAHCIKDSGLVRPSPEEGINKFLDRIFFGDFGYPEYSDIDLIVPAKGCLFIENRISLDYGYIDSEVYEHIYINIPDNDNRTIDYSIPSNIVQVYYYKRIHLFVQYGYGTEGTVRVERKEAGRIYISANVRLKQFLFSPDDYFIEKDESCKQDVWISLRRIVAVSSAKDIINAHGNIKGIEINGLLDELNDSLAKLGE